MNDKIGRIQKVFLSILVILILLSCEDNKPSKPVVVRNDELNINDLKLDSIVAMIDLHEYLKRENYGGEVYSEEHLKQLKDSINYDSIVLRRALKNKMK
jgi:hypothetical protein